MKILFITNAPFHEACDELNIQRSNAAGWVQSAAKTLLDHNNEIELAIASCSFVTEFKQITKNGITHYVIPYKIGENIENKQAEIFWQQINNQFKPDVVHIYGSEHIHSYSWVKACGANNVVVSLQGLVSVYEKYYLGGIKKSDLLKSITFRDIVRLDTVFSQKKKMQTRGKFEKLLFKKVNFIEGRTTWDRDHVWALNPNAKYYTCNRTLRSVFYEKEWSLENCEKHSIFISQAYYPIKGLHQLLKALPIVLKHYPDTKVYIAGTNFFTNMGIRQNGFGSYINFLIKKLKISDHLIFTGVLNEEEMSQQFIRSHIFVCPSAIENAPNSIGEAQILGVPCIASYVGGNADMVQHGETGLLYRFEELEMLASNICRLFSDDKLALKISEKGKIVAVQRHNRIQNANMLYQIYSEIIKQNNN